MNLVINGAEAIPAGQNGTVLVSTGVQDVNAEYLKSTFAESELKEGHYVTLEVQDTGMGMDEQTMSHIFDPFFTTKFTGRGLGLAAVIRIVRGHKGALRIYSVPGHGSTFKVLFPATESVHLAAPKQPVQDSALEGSGIILVIDDEEIVRRTARTALERFGYSVMIAEDGEKRIKSFHPIADKVGLVLLDMTMPGLSGEETFRELRTVRPELKVILSSGFNEVEAIRRFTGKGLAGFLQKPYTSARLAEKIKSVLQTN
jgi:CheY-like chemotaxis protein